MKEGRVYGNSPVEPPKCSVMVRVRHHTTTRRKERVEVSSYLRTLFA